MGSSLVLFLFGAIFGAAAGIAVASLFGIGGTAGATVGMVSTFAAAIIGQIVGAKVKAKEDLKVDEEKRRRDKADKAEAEAAAKRIHFDVEVVRLFPQSQDLTALIRVTNNGAKPMMVEQVLIQFPGIEAYCYTDPTRRSRGPLDFRIGKSIDLYAECIHVGGIFDRMDTHTKPMAHLEVRDGPDGPWLGEIDGIGRQLVYETRKARVKAAEKAKADAESKQ